MAEAITRKSTALRISPMLAVSGIQETLDFYTEVLDFEVSMKSPDYSILDRDNATTHLMKASPRAQGDPSRNR